MRPSRPTIRKLLFFGIALVSIDLFCRYIAPRSAVLIFEEDFAKHTQLCEIARTINSKAENSSSSFSKLIENKLAQANRISNLSCLDLKTLEIKLKTLGVTAEQMELLRLRAFSTIPSIRGTLERSKT